MAVIFPHCAGLDVQKKRRPACRIRPAPTGQGGEGWPRASPVARARSRCWPWPTGWPRRGGRAWPWRAPSRFYQVFARMGRRFHDNRDQPHPASSVLELFAHPFLD